jgi:hypothetical protein
MALISLKQEGDAEYAKPTSYAYGYGTEISLDGEQCEALGITSIMNAGQMVTIQAKGVVTRASEEIEASDDSGGKDIYLCIQLTDIEVRQNGEPNSAKAASMLYGPGSGAAADAD